MRLHKYNRLKVELRIAKNQMIQLKNTFNPKYHGFDVIDDEFKKHQKLEEDMQLLQIRINYIVETMQFIKQSKFYDTH